MSTFNVVLAIILSVLNITFLYLVFSASKMKLSNVRERTSVRRLRKELEAAVSELEDAKEVMFRDRLRSSTRFHMDLNSVQNPEK